MWLSSKAPQAFAQDVVVLALPFAGQELDDRVAADDVLAAVTPLRVDGVRAADTFGVAAVPGVLGGLHLLDGRRQCERREAAGGCRSWPHPAPPVWARRGWLIVTVMDFAMSAKASDYHKRLSEFITDFVFPAEADYDNYREEAGPKDHTVPPIIEELKTKAKAAGCGICSCRRSPV